MDEKRLHLDPQLNRELRETRSRKLLLLVAATLILAALVLSSLAVLTVRARGPAPVPAVIATAVPHPSLRLVPAEGAPGTSILVTGEGWRQWDTVVMRLDGFTPERETQVPLGFAAVSQEGRFTHSFVLPSGAPWDSVPYVQVTAWSPATGDQALARLLMPDKPAATQPSPPPSPAPLTITGWRGEYYSNRELRGEPALVRDDAEVNFDWGRSAPVDGLPADDFSVRWVRTAEFDGTTYCFHVWADDGFRLWVDDRLILDAWWDGGLRERTMDYTPVRGTHHLRVEYYERTGEARIHAWWEKVTSPSYPDWKGEYWSNRDRSGSPALVRNDPSLNFDWGWEPPATGLPADSFSARWTRAVAFDAATYRFHVLVDDGVRLWVDGHLILDTWRDGVREVTADHAMAGGPHDLRVEYYEYSGEARIHLWWESVE
jgi:hypothetical protein